MTSTYLITSATSATDTLRERIDELGPWLHNLPLGGIQTAPDHFLSDYPQFKWQRLADALPQDLSGWSVLDILQRQILFARDEARRCRKRGRDRLRPSLPAPSRARRGGNRPDGMVLASITMLALSGCRGWQSVTDSQGLQALQINALLFWLFVIVSVTIWCLAVLMLAVAL